MINKKQLRGMLRCGKIRLIAKKNSDLAKIKSWRTIFCLSTVYKIFSGHSYPQQFSGFINNTLQAVNGS